VSWRAAWTRFREWGLGVDIRFKIMGIVLGVAVLIGGVAILSMMRNASNTWRRHIQNDGVWLARTITYGGLDLLLTEDTAALSDYIRQLQRDGEDIVYILVLDEEGRPVSHTLPHPVSEELLAVNPLRPGQEWSLRGLRINEEIVWDVAMPVMGGQAGTVRVGVSEETSRQDLAGDIRALLLAIVAVTLVALALSFWLTQILAGRIRLLVDITDAAGRGEFGVRADVGWHDEIGHLGDTFNLMMERLGRARVALRRKEEMRLHLLHSVLGAQEEERKRVSRELHDQTGQAITSLLVGLRLVEESETLEEARDRLKEVRALGKQTLGEVRDLAWELRPTVLDDLGLAAALDNYVGRCEQRFGFEVDWCMTRRWPARLPHEMETTLYRIIQEALTNVARHAEAGQVSLVLDQRQDEIQVIVEDDGRGFDVEGVLSRSERPALGILGMKERAGLLGGTLELESVPGKGTSVFVRFPLVVTDEALVEGGTGRA